MPLPFRALRLALLAPLALAIAPQAHGQDAADPAHYIADKGAWLYKGSDITPDPGWHFGTLTNGVRYAVRRNGVPPGQVSIRVRMDVGSLMEKDSERGYAHLIEHLSFRGSAYVPDGEAKRVWQRMGTTFGSDTNAQTTFTQTVFKLDLPSATPAGLDESMKILAGMVEKPNITTQAIAAERPAVLAERREGLGPQQRFGEAVFGTLFAGQPLADRQPIGKLETLDAATAASVQAFHDRWYRPERAVIVVSGDMDPAVFEQLVAKYFGDWKGIGAKTPDPDFGKPSPNAPKATAVVEAGLPVSLQIATVRPWKYNDDTVIFNQERLIDSIALQVINRRLENHARAGGSYIGAQASLDDIARSVNLTSINIIPVGDDWQAAVKDVRQVIADAMAAPPSKAEVDQEVAEIGEQFRTMAQTAEVDAGAKLADDMVQAVDIRETTTAPATMNTVFLDAKRKGMFTPARIWASTKRVFNGVATRAIINVHKPEAGLAAQLTAALDAPIKADPAKRGTTASVSFAELPRLGTPGVVVSRQSIDLYHLKMEQVQFANGVRLLLNASNSEASRVYVRVRFGGGYNALPADKPSPAWAAATALMAGGIGKLGQDDLDRMTAGRRMGFDFGIDDDAFTMGAMTSPADLKDQLRLFAAKLAAPGWDPAPIARTKTIANTTYDAMNASPDAVLSRELEGLLHDGDPRWVAPDRAQIAALTPAGFRALWEPILASGPIEIDVFGDIDANATVKAVADTFGALAPRTASTAVPPPIRFPAHVTSPVIRYHTGAPDRAIAVIAWPTGGGLANTTDGRRLDILANVFTDRLFDRLRSEAGASYSPNVASTWPDGSASGGRIMAIGQVAPDNVPLFFKLSREIAADLVAHPVSDDELKRTLGPMAQLLQRQATGNQFWLNQVGGAAFDPAKVPSVAHLY
ncbi:MAG: insulinase family protein, partial [Pseudomonadota bacterium]|nr:insulinase family protein [Pseudomonadota bacterium]